MVNNHWLFSILPTGKGKALPILPHVPSHPVCWYFWNHFSQFVELYLFTIFLFRVTKQRIRPRIVAFLKEILLFMIVIMVCIFCYFGHVFLCFFKGSSTLTGSYNLMQTVKLVVNENSLGSVGLSAFLTALFECRIACATTESDYTRTPGYKV